MLKGLMNNIAVPFKRYHNFEQCFNENQMSQYQFYVSKVIKREDSECFVFYNFECPQELYIYMERIQKEISNPKLIDSSKISYLKNLLTFNECLLPFHPRKMYYDIDIPSNESSFEKAESIKDDLITSLISHFQFKNLSKEVMVTTSHRRNKYSYHILLPLVGINVDLPDELTTFGLDIKRKWSEYIRNFHIDCLNTMPQDSKKYVDTSIYSHFQNFRMLGQNKFNLDNPFIYSQWKYKDQIIQKYIPEIDFIHHISEPERLIQKTIFERSCINIFHHQFDGTMVQLKMQMDQIQKFPQNSFLDINLSEDPRIIFRRIYPDISDKLNDAQISESIENRYFNFINVNGYHCPICKRTHEHQNPYLFIKKDHLSGVVGLWFNCRRNKDSLFISKLEEIKNVKPSGQTTGTNKIEYLMEPKFTNTYDEKYCLPIVIPEHSIYFLSAGLGKGKTKVIIDFINQKINVYPEIKILILSPRQIFAASLLNRINQENLKFECYLNLKPNEYNVQKRFIVQMESLQHIYTNYDIIIIDEVESCLAQFESSETMKYHLKSCCDTFERLIKNSTYVICCDAFLSTKSTQVISKITDKKKIICKNTSPLVRRKAIEYDTIMSLIESLLQDLKLNKKIFFVSASKEKVDYLEKLILKHLPEKKYKVYHSSSKEKITNVNQDWKDVDLIVVSPSVTVGVNYDLEDFDLLYLYGSPNSCCVRDIFQSSMRVRHIKENIMKYSVCKAFQSNNKDENVFSLKNIAERIREDKSLQKEFYQCVIDKPRSDGIVYLDQNWMDMSNWMFLNKVYTMKEKNQSKCFYKRIFYYYLGLCNYEYDMDEQIRLETKINLYEFKKEIDYDKVPDLNSSDEVKEVMKRIRDEPEYFLSVMKFNFNRMFKTEFIDPEHINKLFLEYICQTTRKKFHNLKREKNNYGYHDIDRSDLIRNVFWENSNKSAIKVFRIKEINSILGIENSCDSIILNEEDTEKVIEKIYPMYVELSKIFNVKEQVLKKNIDIRKERRTKVKFILDQIFQKWNGSKVTITSKQKMINGDRIYIYQMNKRSCGIKISEENVSMISLLR
jgi:hypothetical protein